ncbi:energy-coupling factor transporter transmembrane component T family protein [Leucobacter insecticola]|uniref:energy-coupling factor transporter transmembrane component T family protein n=1 Tax=Leucobacter insecticola TaxID=2714934 RepID=UPI001FCC2DDD|nr:energy-coupling factor transporter transmembrane component T [Leucobacter insecticola]
MTVTPRQRLHTIGHAHDAPEPARQPHLATRPLHRLRPGAKLLGLFVFAVAVVWFSSLLTSAISLGIAAALALLAGLRGRELWRATRGFLLIAIPLFALTAAAGAHSADLDRAEFWVLPPEALIAGVTRGLEIVGRLFALILAASAVTASTALEDMVDTITWLLRPYARWGVDPERVALAFSIVITAIPSILGIARQTRDAARARGVERNPRALVVPLVIRTVAHAQLTGEALAARGLGEREQEAPGTAAQ